MDGKKNSYTVIISVIVAIFLIEISLRIIGFNKYQFKGYPPYYLTKVGKYDNFDIKENITETEFIFNDSTPHKVWGNEVGCFDESVKNISNNYILIAGDSNSWGYVPYDKNWSYLLEKKINRKVLNCSVPAYSTIQELYKTKKILGKLEGNEKDYASTNSNKNLYNPSLIILQYTFNNDFLGDYLFPQYKLQNNILTTNKTLDNIFKGTIRYKEENKFWDRLKYDLNQKLYTFRVLHRGHYFLREKIKNFNKKEKKISKTSTSPRFVLTSFDLSYLNFEKFPWAKKAWKDHLKNILEFKKISDDVGAELLFVFWGDLPDYSRNHFKQALDMQKQFKKKDHLININNDELLFKFLEENNINYLNLSKLAWDLVGYKSLIDDGERLRDVLIWRNDNHPNIEGNKFMSEKIYNKLLDDNIIDIGVDK
tara:strand:- start:989 stop:2260 length:1272 start_codon:yes stop_codon:yes gene_type:complete